MRKLLTLLIMFMAVIATPQLSYAQESESLETVLAETVKKAVDVAEKTGQWALDVAPEIIQEYLMWGFYSNLLLSTVAFLFLLTLFYTIPKSLDYSIPTGLEMALVAYHMIVPITSIIIFVQGLHQMLLITVAPKVYLIQQFL